MSKFISINNLIEDQGFAFECNGTIFTTKYFGNTRIICMTSSAIFFIDVMTDKNTEIQDCTMHPTKPLLYTGGYFRINDNIVYKTDSGIQSTSISASSGIDIEAFYRKVIYFTANMVGSSLLRPKSKVLASSKVEPLVLYISENNNKLSLAIYNLESNEDIVINEFGIAENTVNNTAELIKNCQAYFGGFETAKQHDIFINCEILDFSNSILFKSKNYKNDLSLAFNCLATDKLHIIDFNGDKYSDILCIKSKQVIVNNQGQFTRIIPLSSMPSNFNQNFINQNVYFGDFDGNGVSDLLTSTGTDQKIVFGSALNYYVTADGTANNLFLINGLNNWCVSGNIVISDFDNDDKDDILCNNNNEIYIVLSRTNSINSGDLLGIKKAEVTLDNFRFDLKGTHIIKSDGFPIFCNTTGIKEYTTKLGCVLVEKNSVESITSPILASQSIRNLSFTANIKSSYDLFANNISIKNPANELINPESFEEPDKEAFYDIMAPNSANVRNFNSQYYREYYRDNLIKTKTTDSSKYTFSHIIRAGACNKLYFNYTLINTGFSAEVTIKLFDHLNNLITNRQQLSNFFNLYASGNVEEVAINAKGITATYRGSIVLKTPYQKTVTHCNEKVLFQNVAKTNVKNSEKNDALCTLEKSKTIINDIETIHAIKREDVMRMNGYIYLGYGVFPFNIKNFKESIPFEASKNIEVQLLDAAQSVDNLINDLKRNKDNINNAIQVEINAIKAESISYPEVINSATNIFVDQSRYEETYSNIIYDSNLRMVAYIKNTGKCPSREIRIQFYYNNALYYEAASPYAAFDNIEKVSLEAFSKTKVVLLWSMFVKDKNQFFILADFLNTETPLLKIAAFDSQFKLITHAKNEINTMIICYQKSKNVLTLLKTYVDLSGFRLANITSIDLDGNGYIAYDIKKYNDDSFYLIKHYNNNKGIFIQRYDFSFEKIGIEHNIQAHPSNIKLDIYNNSMVVVWTENYYRANRCYIQIIQDEVLNIKTKLFELETPVELKSVQLTAIKDIADFYTLPSTEVLIKVNNAPYLLSFDNNFRLTNIKRYVFDTNTKKTNIQEKAINNPQLENIFITNQQSLKEVIENSKKQEKCLIGDSLFVKQSKQILKQDSIDYRNFANQNSQYIANFYFISESKSEPPYEGKPIIYNKGKIQLAAIAYDTLMAQNNLQIYIQGNDELSSHKLFLNFQHNSYLLNAKISQKQDLEQAIQYVYTGIERAIDNLSKNYQSGAKTVSSLLCSSIVNPSAMKNVLLAFKGALASKTIYKFIQDSSLSKCQDNTYYPTYKDGDTINICPTYGSFNLDNECKRIFTLARLTKHEIKGFNKDVVAENGPFISNIVQNIDNIYNNIPVNENQICTNLNPYKLETGIIHNLAKSIIIGLITKETKKIQDTSSCKRMALNECSSASDIKLNDACYSDYIYANAMLYQLEHSVDSKINTNENCYNGCELNSPALSSLLSRVNGNLNSLFTTNDLLNTTLLPNLTISITKSVKYNTTEYATHYTYYNESTINVTHEMNITSTEEPSYFNNSAYTNIYDLTSSYVVNFRNLNLTLVSSILKGSGFYEVRAQYFIMPEQKPYGLEMSLGKFDSIKQLKVESFDEYNLLVAFTTKNLDMSQYNIFINVLTGNNSRILNIYPSFEGNFDIRAIPNTKDFIVSYTNDKNTFITKQYTITASKIIEKIKTEKVIEDNNFNGVFSYISNIIKNTFDVIWGGYYKQTVSTIGSEISFTNYSKEKDVSIAASSNQYATAVAVQNASHISVDTFNQDSKQIQNKQIFNITDWKLQNMQYIQSDIVVLTLYNINNTVQRVVLNTRSHGSLTKQSYYFVANEFVNSKLVETINNGRQIFETQKVTEFDNIISATSICKYLLSGHNEGDTMYSTLMAKGKSDGYLKVLQEQIAGKQSSILKEALAMQKNYSLNDIYQVLNMTTNDMICVINTDLKENLYSQMSGIADAVNFVSNTSFLQGL